MDLLYRVAAHGSDNRGHMQPLSHFFWFAITRLGEAQVLLPAMLIMALWLVHRSGATRVATLWLLLTGIAATLTTVTKVAFIGWGMGLAAVNFTGISGHSMFASAVLPVLSRACASTADDHWHRPSLLFGYALAIIVTISRVATGAHSVSEAVTGFALGGAASAAVLALTAMPHTPLPRLLLAGLALWLVATTAGAPPSRTHDMVTRLSLSLSGHTRPYTRHDMWRQYRRQQQELERQQAESVLSASR
jgi:membrane-associated phospholipid phosphatase